MNTDISEKNQTYIGALDRASLYDLETPSDWNGKLIIFIHGYMGYKDWGCWDFVQSFFTEKGYGFIKYNASHNGGTAYNPIDFDDLEAFSNNSYSNEILDFEAIIRLVNIKFKETPKIYLIGHSRGGGIALLQSENELVSKICSWAGIASIADRFPNGEALAEWKSSGMRYGINGRTKQKMPHSINQYYDYIENKDRLDIETYCKNSKIPTLIVHGEKDTSVDISEGDKLAAWLDTDLSIIKDTQHTFDSSQPWTRQTMPKALQEVCERTLDFLNE